MALELERKFLVVGDDWRALARASRTIRQGYLSQGAISIRIRLTDDRAAVLTIKAADQGIARKEFEYDVPLADATELLSLCADGQVEKTRYEIPAGPVTWEIDEFAGRNAGLIIAEIELDHASQAFAMPNWLGREVTDEQRYYNASLSTKPFHDW